MKELFVPGRLCLFGEHSDWAGAYRTARPELSPGYCLVAGTDQGLWAEVEPVDGRFEIASILPDGKVQGPERYAAHAETLAAAARARGFFSYAAGVAAEVSVRHQVGGLRVQVHRADLPIGKGLSSSAAICVLVARAYNLSYRLGLGVHEEMELAYAGERLAGSACGRMDQVCAFGQRTIFLTFDGSSLEVEALAVRRAVHLLVVDLRRGKDTRRILADLNACFPDVPGALASCVREALGPLNADLLARARNAVMAGDGRRLGALMDEAQRTFDEMVTPVCQELSAPRLHGVLSHPAVRELAWGGKGVGSQGDGSAQLVARGVAERDELAARLARELGVACFPLTLRQGRPPA